MLLRKYAKRMVCCCTIHTNMEYLQHAALRYTNISNTDSCFKSNELLCRSVLCENYNVDGVNNKKMILFSQTSTNYGYLLT